jgi:hypothetical protein
MSEQNNCTTCNEECHGASPNSTESCYDCTCEHCESGRDVGTSNDNDFKL